jgi:hypothetical protein
VFDSYYWHGARLDPDLERARSAVRDGDVKMAVDAFRALLASPRVAANGIALDHYHYAEATSRFGVENPFAVASGDVVNTARALLDAPPVVEGADGASIAGANHASALGALVNLADESDADRLADVIEGRPDPVVLGLALQCAGTVLETGASPGRLATVVRGLAQDPEVPARERGNALHLVALTDPGIAEHLAGELIGSSDLRLQADAAWLLADRDLDHYRQLLEEVVGSWPDDAPYPAFEVRQLLEE